jgi:hypothetical protein
MGYREMAPHLSPSPACEQGDLTILPGKSAETCRNSKRTRATQKNKSAQSLLYRQNRLFLPITIDYVFDVGSLLGGTSFAVMTAQLKKEGLHASSRRRFLIMNLLRKR